VPATGRLGRTEREAMAKGAASSRRGARVKGAGPVSRAVGRRGRRVPERMCVCCRRREAKERLLRWVPDPDGKLVLDYHRRLPGRGAYTCADPSCLREAHRRRAFAWALKRPVEVPDAAQLERAVLRAAEGRMGSLVRAAVRSGKAVVGGARIADALKRGEGELLLTAGDLARNGTRKYEALVSHGRAENRSAFSKRELGRLLGRAEVGALLITDAGLARELAAEWAVFHAFREGVTE